MIKKIIVTMMICSMIFGMTNFVIAGGTTTKAVNPKKCLTTYPIILAHGMACNDKIGGLINYWYKIKDYLEAEGAKVYITSVSQMNSTEKKGEEFAAEFRRVQAISGASKYNIIGHSHGTMYTRHAITNEGIGKFVASHTSLCGPHRGSSVADLVVGSDGNSVLGKLAGVSLDLLYGIILGDKSPDSLDNGIALTNDYCANVFNPNTPNYSGIYYQSWASKIQGLGATNLVLNPTYFYMLLDDGDNDGLVDVDSAKWGNFRGVESGSFPQGGIDHFQLTNNFLGNSPGFDAKNFYVSLVEDLKNRGY